MGWVGGGLVVGTEVDQQPYHTLRISCGLLEATRTHNAEVTSMEQWEQPRVAIAALYRHHSAWIVLGCSYINFSPMIQP